MLPGVVGPRCGKPGAQKTDERFPTPLTMWQSFVFFGFFSVLLVLDQLGISLV